jgi:hypothetical protein
MVAARGKYRYAVIYSASGAIYIKWYCLRLRQILLRRQSSGAER